MTDAKKQGNNGNAEKGKAQEMPLLTTVQKLGYGVGHVLNDLCSALWFTYAALYYTAVMGFTTYQSGMIVFVGQIADALATPIIGIGSDKCSLWGFSYFGKRKSWYILGTLMVLGSMPLMYSPCIGCTEAATNYQLVYFSSFVVIFQFGWAAVQTVHLALSSDLSNDQNVRTSLLSLRNTFTVVSNLVVYAIAIVVLKVLRAEHELDRDDSVTFQLIVASILILGLFTSLFFFLTVRENDGEPLLNEETQEEVNQPRTYSHIFSKKSLYHTAFIYMATRIYCNVMQTLSIMYLHIDLELKPLSLAIMPFVMYIFSGLFSMLTPLMSRALGKKLMFTLGAIIALLACLWIYLDASDYYKLYFVYIVAALLGASSSILLVGAYTITNDFIGSDVGNGAFIYGMMSFVDKLSCGIIIWAILACQVTNSSVYYRYALALVCGVSALTANIAVVFLKN